MTPLQPTCTCIGTSQKYTQKCTATNKHKFLLLSNVDLHTHLNIFCVFLHCNPTPCVFRLKIFLPSACQIKQDFIVLYIY